MAQKQTENRKTKREPNPPVMIAYAVSDRGRGQKFWTRLGGVWAHKNGEGFNIYVNVLPTDFDGRIVLLPPRDESENAEDGEDLGEVDETGADETEGEEAGA